MRLRKAIKKIVALAAGMSMLGTTILGATAADLSNFPAPFIKDGAFNGVIVVGDSAAASDVVGSVDIATSLQFSATTTTAVRVPGAASGVTLMGDAVEVGTPADLLEIGEDVGEVRETITEVETDALKGGLIITDEGATEYNQYLRFKDTETNITNNGKVLFTANDDRQKKVADFLYIAEGTNESDAVFEFQLEFEEGLESEVDTTKNDLKDLEDKELNVLGTPFTVVETDIRMNTYEVTLELIAGEALDTLQEGETKTYTIDGIDYEVEVLVIADTANNGDGSVKFRVNGEVSDALTDGETDVLADGLEIGIREIMPNEAGDVTQDLVEFFLGANKIKLQDKEYIDAAFEQGVEVTGEDIEDAYVKIAASNLSTSVVEISDIKYRLIADALPGTSDIYIPAGHGLRQYLDEPEGMLSPGWDIKYEGLMNTGVSVIRLDPRGDDEYTLEFENRQGQEFKIPLITNEGGTTKYGDDDDDLIFAEGVINTSVANCTNHTIGRRYNMTYNVSVAGSYAACNFNIGDNDYFVVSDMGKAWDETAFSHVLRYGSIDTSNNQISFEDEGSGSTRTVIYQAEASINATLGKGELVVGGNSYTVYVLDNSSANYPLAIDQNNDGDVGINESGLSYGTTNNYLTLAEGRREEIRITVQGGGILDLGAGNKSDSGDLFYSGQAVTKGVINLTLVTLNSEFDENGPYNAGGDESVNITVQVRANNEIGLDTNPDGVTLRSPDEDDDHKLGMTPYGVWFDLYDEKGSSEAETLTIEYPLSQRGAQVFVTFGATKRAEAGGGGGEITTTVVTPIEVGAAKLASEVSNVKATNAIVVGGPCANAAAADLIGVAQSIPECLGGLSLEAGEAVIKLYEQTNGNVAMLVAGATAMDSRRAARVVANAEDYALTGKEVKVTGTSLTDISVSVAE